MGKRVPPHRREEKKAVQDAVEEMHVDFEADAEEDAAFWDGEDWGDDDHWTRGSWK